MEDESSCPDAEKPLWKRLKDALADVSPICSLVLGVGGFFIPADDDASRAQTLARLASASVRAVLELLT